METDLPDWLQPTHDSALRTSAHHLGVLRELLGRDYLNQPDWGSALRDLAQMARQALNASEALVATFQLSTRRWSAVSSQGLTLADDQISAYGSRSVLEAVRGSGQPLLAIEDLPLELRSASLSAQQVQSVLAVPLVWWDIAKRSPEHQLLGCLYAHRTRRQGHFTQDDVRLMLDITRIAQPNLNLLRYLQGLQTDLQASRTELAELRQSTAQTICLGQYETRDPWFGRHVLGKLRRVTHADKVGLLILGPTGSGKSHLARAYHYECPRRSGPFVTLDCSQVTSAETLSAELFGYAPASGYANAPPKGRAGKAQQAHGGTLFVDEIGALPVDLQQRLLRLIQDGLYSPLGSSDELLADLQIIAATNEELAELVRQKRFREDLLWRISEVTVKLPPLTRRAADIPALADLFLNAACKRFRSKNLQGFTDAALSVLLRHDWAAAGNVRGLEHTINRAVLLAQPGINCLDVEHIELQDVFDYSPPASLASLSQPPSSRPVEPDPRNEALRQLAQRKLTQHGGKIRSMAQDPELCAAFGYAAGRMPDSTLAVWIRRLRLNSDLAQERQRQRPSLELDVVLSAIRQHGSAAAAARGLGVTRDALLWPLRRASLTVEAVLGSST